MQGIYSDDNLFMKDNYGYLLEGLPMHPSLFFPFFPNNTDWRDIASWAILGSCLRSSFADINTVLSEINKRNLTDPFVIEKGHIRG